MPENRAESIIQIRRAVEVLCTPLLQQLEAERPEWKATARDREWGIRELASRIMSSALLSRPIQNPALSHETSISDEAIKSISEGIYNEIFAGSAAAPDYLISHFRHPALPESRCTTSVLGDGAIERTARTANLSGNRHLVTQVHQAFVQLYFDLVGRSDSFTDTVLRAVDSNGVLSKVRIVRFRVVPDENPWGDLKGEHRPGRGQSGEYVVTVSEPMRSRLLQTGGSPTIFHMDRVLLEYVRIHEAEAEEGHRRRSLDEHRRLLDHQCFFTTREAILAGESVRIFHNEALRRECLAIHMDLFPDLGQPDPQSCAIRAQESILAIRRVLAIIQAASMFIDIASDEFTLFISKPKCGLSSTLTVGGTGAVVRGNRAKLLALTEALVQLLEGTLEGISPSRDFKDGLDEIVEPSARTRMDDVLLRHESFRRETFYSVLYLGKSLAGRKHEGKNIRFLLAAGPDSQLRQHFNLVHTIGDATHDDYTVAINRGNDWLEERNQLRNLAYLIQGNYSFVQERDVFVCVSSSPDGLFLRYLGHPNPRYVQKGSVDEWRPGLRRRSLAQISMSVRGVLLLHLDSSGEGLAALDGEVVLRLPRDGCWQDDDYAATIQRIRNEITKAVGAQPPVAQGRRRSKGNRSTLAAESAVPETLTNFVRDHSKFVQLLATVITEIRTDPTAGATFVLGESKDLSPYLDEMAPVFETVPGWSHSSAAGDLEKHLFELAIQDGATVIAADEQRVIGRRKIVAPAMFTGDKRKPYWDLWRDKDGYLSWEDWGKWRGWGTRHQSAAALAYELEGRCVVISVSQDGDVHLFDGRKIRQIE